jgi:RND family efflux transporter MFP subunit
MKHFPAVLRRGLWAAVVLFAAASVRGAADGVEGFLEPYRHIDVAAPEAGILETISVAEGDRVAAQQVLAELKQDTLRAALRVSESSRDARGKLDAAAAELKLRADLLEKLTALQARTHATQEEVDRAGIEKDMAAARLLTVQEELEIRELECRRIETEIDNRRLRSPIDGVVIRLAKDQGEYVSPNDPVVLTVVQLDVLKGVFSVPPAVARSLQPAQSVELIVGDATTRVPAVVEFVSPLVDPRSGTVQVTTKVANEPGLLSAGQRCRLLTGSPAAPLANDPAPQLKDIKAAAKPAIQKTPQ